MKENVHPAKEPAEPDSSDSLIRISREVTADGASPSLPAEISKAPNRLESRVRRRAGTPNPPNRLGERPTIAAGEPAPGTVSGIGENVIRPVEPSAGPGLGRGSARGIRENVIRPVESSADAGVVRGIGEPTGIRGSQGGEAVGDIRAMVAEFSDAMSRQPIEAMGELNPRLLAESVKEKLGAISENGQPRRELSADPRDLEDLVANILSVVQSVGDEAVARAAESIVRDQASLEVLRNLAEDVGRLTEVAAQVAEKITPTESNGGSAIFWWVLAGAILLALGVATVPLVWSVTVESIVTNELAVAVIACSLVAVLKEK